jgi:uncharacterized membrane protein
MPQLHVMVGSDASPALPVVRKIGMMELNERVAKSIEDVWAFATHVIYCSFIYPSSALCWPG